MPGVGSRCNRTCLQNVKAVRGESNMLRNSSAQIEPDKDLVGYVRSPKGLAVKLVNDHLFKIPGWVGFALDPVGHPQTEGHR